MNRSEKLRKFRLRNKLKSIRYKYKNNDKGSKLMIFIKSFGLTNRYLDLKYGNAIGEDLNE